MSKVTSMHDAVATAVDDGDSLYLAGFTHLIPFAAGHEIIRQGRTDLELIRATPDLIYDQLIAAGCARKVTFSWAGNPGVGSLPAFRRAAEEGYPTEIELEEYTHFGMIAALEAGASNLPFMPLRGFIGSDLPEHNDNIARVESPFDDDYVYAVAPIEPDVAVVRAQRADEDGNAHLWGIQGEVKLAALAADTVILSVEEQCSEETIRSDPNRTVITADEVDHVVVEPYGSHPSYAQGYYGRDNEAYLSWAETAADRDTVEAWLDEWVYGVDDRREYVEKLGTERILDLEPETAYATPVNMGEYR
ncbi:3-oxoacid CoA-transferase alpha subunit (plasmid) [Natrialba magadii ATCC 43099]|uniref:3-oxoacid CoA-transferase alpha subunit n=2 Tax=Natrialba magadii (strain ATCC 43099 / DSM 3394 / CCM 3739 / CIP 104546 / IAM 13178 / JCM 8861 / NBRC 102185 / NCIMB 2190 / MS3) TaxID=547559 RepID=D3T1K5_NATMM|nr:3-oxoacid CoA-transferase alpha subunit [Natrialba magadii ATCC 43099]